MRFELAGQRASMTMRWAPVLAAETITSAQCILCNAVLEQEKIDRAPGNPMRACVVPASVPMSVAAATVYSQPAAAGKLDSQICRGDPASLYHKKFSSLHLITGLSRTYTSAAAWQAPHAPTNAARRGKPGVHGVQPRQPRQQQPFRHFSPHQVDQRLEGCAVAVGHNATDHPCICVKQTAIFQPDT